MIFSTVTTTRSYNILQESWFSLPLAPAMDVMIHCHFFMTKKLLLQIKMIEMEDRRKKLGEEA